MNEATDVHSICTTIFENKKNMLENNFLKWKKEQNFVKGFCKGFI